jgi:hypothetical protein
MSEATPHPAFEVYCHRCRVTFPVGARRCVHCGGPIEKDPPLGAPSRQARIAARMRAGPSPAAPPELALPPVTEDEVDDDVLEGGFRRRGIFSPVALMWVVLAIAMTVYRACTGAPA